MKPISDATPSSPPTRIWAGIGITTVIVVVLLATLAGWARHGTEVLFTYAQAGLAWCF